MAILQARRGICTLDFVKKKEKLLIGAMWLFADMTRILTHI